MAKPYSMRLDPNNDAMMEAFNAKLTAFVKKFHYSSVEPPEFVPSFQAAYFMGCSKQDVNIMVFRGVMARGPDRGTVSLDDVIAKLVVAPFVERT